MKHIRLKIRPKFLASIANGTKKHEYRLNTEDRAKIKNGDRLTLISNQEPSSFIVVTVRAKKTYPSWEEALKENWEEDFKGNFDSYDEVLKECYKFYSKDQVEEHGIVRYEIEPFKRKTRKNRVLLDTNIIIQREGYNTATFEVAKLYNWLDKLGSTKYVYHKTIEEINKYYDKTIRDNISTKLNSYNTLIPKGIDDAYFLHVISNFARDENSEIDNELLFQAYEGLVDLLITNDGKMLKKAEKLNIREIVLSVDEYLKVVEKEYPEKVDYKMLSIRKRKFGELDLNDPFFDTLKEDYPEFSDWFYKKNQEEAYVFSEKGSIHGFLFVKVEYQDEPDYMLIEPPLSKKKRLKVGTFKIDTTLEGFRLSERFIKIIIDNALENNVDEIYVTLFEDKRDEVKRLRDVLCRWGFYKHGYKPTNRGEKESVFVKTLEKYDKDKGIKYNFPNLPQNQRMFFLPIAPEYHTQLFPDAILRNEDITLYSENKAHFYSLEKIYVSGYKGNAPKPGDYIVIYRNGERVPKKYSSVCTGVTILEEIKMPRALGEYLNECSNKSVFTKEELINFYNDKKYRTVVKLIQYKTYFKKISLSQLIDAGLMSYDSGPRPFTEIPEDKHQLFLEEEDNK